MITSELITSYEEFSYGSERHLTLLEFWIETTIELEVALPFVA